MVEERWKEERGNAMVVEEDFLSFFSSSCNNGPICVVRNAKYPFFFFFLKKKKEQGKCSDKNLKAPWGCLAAETAGRANHRSGPMKQPTIDFSLVCWANSQGCIFCFAIHVETSMVERHRMNRKRSWQGRHWCACDRSGWSVALWSAGWRYRRKEDAYRWIKGAVNERLSQRP